MYQVREVVTWHAVAEIRTFVGEYPVMATQPPVQWEPGFSRG
jgi:hypothetical protein